MNKIKKRSQLLSLVKSGLLGIIGLTIGGLSAQAQTTTVAPNTTITTFNPANNYIFSDGAGTSTFDAAVPANVTMNSIQLGGWHTFEPGSRTLTITSGNISFAPTGTDNTWSTLGVNSTTSSVTTSAANLNISNTRTGGAGVNTALVGTNSVTLSSTASQLFINGNNTHSGGTIVNSGQIRISNASAFGTGAVTLNGGMTVFQVGNASISSLVLNGGDLRAAWWIPTSFTQTTIGTLALSSDSTLSFVDAAAETYSFADSSALAWTGNLTLSGFTLGTDSIRFGTDSNGLTSTQLSKIKLASDPSFQFGLNSSGYLVAAIPEPSTYAMVLLSIVAIGFAYRRQLA